MTPTRILVAVSSHNEHWMEARTSARSLEPIVFDILKKEGLLSESSSAKFVAEERFDTRSHLIFDVAYDDYQPENAHLPGQGDLPVLRVWLTKKEGAERASSVIQEMVNGRIRQIHDQTGIGSAPPFLIDYTDGKVPTYWNPRSMKKAPRPLSESEAHESES